MVTDGFSRLKAVAEDDAADGLSVGAGSMRLGSLRRWSPSLMLCLVLFPSLVAEVAAPSVHLGTHLVGFCFVSDISFWSFVMFTDGFTRLEATAKDDAADGLSVGATSMMS